MDTSNKSIQAQGVQIGREDDCSVGGTADNEDSGFSLYSILLGLISES